MRIGTTGALAALLLLALSATTAHAGLRPGEWDLGLRGGVIAATISGLDGSTDRSYGGSGGATIAYSFNEWLGLETGVIYAQKGGEGSGVDASANDAKFVTQLDYVSIPLRVRIPLGAGPVLPYLALGFEYSFLVSAETWFSTDESDKTDAQSLFEDYDFGSVAAIGVEFPVRRVFLFVEGGWTRSFTDVVQAAGLEGKNGTVQMMGGLVLPL